MRYLIAIAVVAFVTGTGLAISSAASLSLDKQSAPTAAQLSARLAQSVDPFLLRSGG